MANFTEGELAAVIEVLTAQFNIPVFDPVPTQKMVYYFALGYADARAGEAQNTDLMTAGKYCNVFCCAYCRGYLVGTT